MTRVRLRDPRSSVEEAAYYARVYPQGYRHDAWPDHIERVKASADLIARYRNNIRTAADLSCGDGALLNMISRYLDAAWFGDLNGVSVSAQVSCSAPRVEALASGRMLPESLDQLPEYGVDLFILSETLEHVPDPDELLRRLVDHTTYLFLSTPVDEPVGSNNLEHYWGWGTDDIHDMLRETGWHPLEKKVLVPESTRHLPDAYSYQMWMAVAR